MIQHRMPSLPASLSAWKTPVFHLVPYSKRFILIGVSYDRVPPAASLFDGEEFIGKNFYNFELLAIPHEIAHYVYQHGKLAGKSLIEVSKKFENHPYYRWCEELFADVYGCIVGGPLAANQYASVANFNNRDRAWKDDEEHPTPVLRLFIMAEILRILRGERASTGCRAGRDSPWLSL